jgi:protein-S-isoprenylcysteine O-methyltransferase Ste14
MEKMKWTGVGPKILLPALITLALTIFFSAFFKGTFRFGFVPHNAAIIAGIAVLAVFVVSYLITARTLMNAINNIKMVTTGPYYLCRNPLYACFMLLLIPGLALVLDSWLILATSLCMYIVFRMKINSEYKMMEQYFGDAWKDYYSRTPELFPFPYKKW